MREAAVVDTGVASRENPGELRQIFDAYPTFHTCRITKAAGGPPSYLLEADELHDRSLREGRRDAHFRGAVRDGPYVHDRGSVKRKYSVAVTLVVDVEVDDRVFKSVMNDEWRSYFYPLRTRGEVLQHVIFNLVQGRSLRSLDGFADLSERDVRVENIDWANWEVTTKKGDVVP